MKKLFISFTEGDADSLKRATDEGDRLGYKKWDVQTALVFEGTGVLTLNNDGTYHTTQFTRKILLNQGYTEHIIQPTYKRGDKVEVRDTYAHKWEERIYLTTIEGAEFPIQCVQENWEQEFENGEKFYFEGWNQIQPLQQTIEIEGKKYDKEEALKVINKLTPIQND